MYKVGGRPFALSEARRYLSARSMCTETHPAGLAGDLQDLNISRREKCFREISIIIIVILSYIKYIVKIR